MNIKDEEFSEQLGECWIIINEGPTVERAFRWDEHSLSKRGLFTTDLRAAHLFPKKEAAHQQMEKLVREPSEALTVVQVHEVMEVVYLVNLHLNRFPMVVAKRIWVDKRHPLGDKIFRDPHLANQELQRLKSELCGYYQDRILEISKIHFA